MAQAAMDIGSPTLGLLHDVGMTRDESRVG